MCVFFVFSTFLRTILSSGFGMVVPSVTFQTGCVVVFRGQRWPEVVSAAAVNTFHDVKPPYICSTRFAGRTSLRMTYIFSAYGAHSCASLLTP